LPVILKLFEKRSFEELSIALEEMINLYPDGSSTWLFVGMYYSQINKLNDAENSFLKSSNCGIDSGFSFS